MSLITVWKSPASAEQSRSSVWITSMLMMPPNTLLHNKPYSFSNSRHSGRLEGSLTAPPHTLRDHSISTYAHLTLACNHQIIISFTATRHSANIYSHFGSHFATGAWEWEGAHRESHALVPAARRPARGVPEVAGEDERTCARPESEPCFMLLAQLLSLLRGFMLTWMCEVSLVCCGSELMLGIYIRRGELGWFPCSLPILFCIYPFLISSSSPFFLLACHITRVCALPLLLVLPTTLWYWTTFFNNPYIVIS